MGKVISVRLSEAEEARIRGAAALSGMAISAYLKWLITQGRTGAHADSDMVLRRLDEIATAVANIRAAPSCELMPVHRPAEKRKLLVTRLKDRGIPSSTIRQVEAVLDELEGKATRAPVAA